MGHNVDGFPVSGASLPFLVMTEEKRKIVVHAPPGRNQMPEFCPRCGSEIEGHGVSLRDYVRTGYSWLIR